jgi:tellurite resistance protein TehA-like permease
MMMQVLHRHGVHTSAVCLWTLATLVHVGLLAWFAWQVVPHVLPHVQAGRVPEAYQPAWMIPPIGICMASGTGQALSMGDWVQGFFWVALAFCVVLLPAAIFRFHGMSEQPVPQRHQATYAIIAAPAALLFCQWVALGGDETHAITHMLLLAEVACLGLVMW